MSISAEIITASVLGLGTLGGGIGFIWTKVEARFAGLEKKVEACEERERKSDDDRTVLLAAAEMLWLEVKRVAPNSAVAKRARQLLDKFKIALSDED